MVSETSQAAANGWCRQRLVVTTRLKYSAFQCGDRVPTSALASQPRAHEQHLTCSTTASRWNSSNCFQSLMPFKDNAFRATYRCNKESSTVPLQVQHSTVQQPSPVQSSTRSSTVQYMHWGQTAKHSQKAFLVAVAYTQVMVQIAFYWCGTLEELGCCGSVKLLGCVRQCSCCQPLSHPCLPVA
jgi:hypothetical protein